jgi:hypothetical protein
MKTSKIIFISLLGTIALFILAATIDFRITGKKIGLVPSNTKVNKVTTLPYKVLSLENSDIRLLQNDTLLIETTSLKDSVAPQVIYSIRNDTLFIKGTRSLQSGRVAVRIHADNSVKGIVLKNSDLTMEHFKSGTLSINLDRSYMWMNEDKSSFNNLQIRAKNHSNIESAGINVDSLGINLEHSEANIGFIAQRISGCLSDSSRLYARQAGEIALKKDSSSNINLNDY